MQNYIQSPTNITVTAPEDVLSGDGVLVGSLFGVASTSEASGDQVTLVTMGVFTLAKLEAQAWAFGAKVYWDDTNKRTTTVASGNTLIGCAVEAATNPSTTGRVRVDGAVR